MSQKLRQVRETSARGPGTGPLNPKLIQVLRCASLDDWDNINRYLSGECTPGSVSYRNHDAVLWEPGAFRGEVLGQLWKAVRRGDLLVLHNCLTADQKRKAQAACRSRGRNDDARVLNEELVQFTGQDFIVRR